MTFKAYKNYCSIYAEKLRKFSIKEKCDLIKFIWHVNLLTYSVQHAKTQIQLRAPKPITA